MNFSKVFGLIVVLTAVFLLMVFENSGINHDLLSVFLNLKAFIFIFGIIIGGILSVFGLQTSLASVKNSLSGSGVEDAEELKVYINFYDLGSRLSIAAGSIALLASLIKMMTSLSDPATIGPSLAIAICSVFQAVIISEFVFQPLKFSLITKSKDFSTDDTKFKTSRFSVLILSGFTVGLFFILLLMIKLI